MSEAVHVTLCGNRCSDSAKALRWQWSWTFRAGLVVYRQASMSAWEGSIGKLNFRRPVGGRETKRERERVQCAGGWGERTKTYAWVPETEKGREETPLSESLKERSPRRTWGLGWFWTPFFETGFTFYPRLASYSLCSSMWSGSCSNPPASPFRTMGVCCPGLWGIDWLWFKPSQLLYYSRHEKLMPLNWRYGRNGFLPVITAVFKPTV